MPRDRLRERARDDPVQLEDPLAHSKFDSAARGERPDERLRMREGLEGATVKRGVAGRGPRVHADHEPILAPAVGSRLGVGRIDADVGILRPEQERDEGLRGGDHDPRAWLGAADSMRERASAQRDGDPRIQPASRELIDVQRLRYGGVTPLAPLDQVHGRHGARRDRRVSDGSRPRDVAERQLAR